MGWATNEWKSTVKELKEAGFDVDFKANFGEDADDVNERENKIQEMVKKLYKDAEDVLKTKKEYWKDLAVQIGKCADPKKKKVLTDAQDTLRNICAGPEVVAQKYRK